MAKENCIICGIIDGAIPSKVLFEDDMVMAVLDMNGSSLGHAFVFPKTHHPIMEQVPDIEISRIFSVANKISMALFETLGSQGTNIFLANGIAAGQTVAHVTVNVIPRKENDGINLQWQPKQLTEEETATAELKLKDQTRHLAVSSHVSEASLPKRIRSEAVTLSGEENYVIKQLQRIP